MEIIKLPQEQGKAGSEKGGIVFQLLAWTLLKILPKANQNYDEYMPSIDYWLIEVNEECQAVREIGFNNRNEPIVFAPTDKNYGLWTDSDRVFNLYEFEKRNDFPFDETWNLLATNK